MGRRIANSTAWALMGRGTVAAASLVYTPFLLRSLGGTGYGAFTLIQALLGYLQFSNVGMDTASTRFGAVAHNRADLEGERAVVWTSLALAAFPLLIATLGLVVFAPTIVERGFRVPPSFAYSAGVALQLAAIAFAVRCCTDIVNTPVVSRLRMDWDAGIKSGGVLLQFGLIAIALYFGRGLVGVFAALTAGEIGILLAQMATAKHLVPRITKPLFRRELLAPLLRFGGPVLLLSFLGAVIANSEKVLIARYSSLSELASYSIAIKLSSLLLWISWALGHAVLPAFSRLHEEHARLEVLYSRTARAMLFLVAPLGVAVAVLARPALTLWVGPTYGAQSVQLSWILIPGFISNAVGDAAYMLLLGTGRGSTIARLHAAEVIPYLLLTALLTNRYGATGAAAAFSLRLFVDALLLLSFAHRAGYRVKIGKHGFAFAAAFTLLGLPIILQIAARTAGVMILGMCMLGFALLTWRSLLLDEERSWLQQYVPKKWSRRTEVA